MTDTDDLIAQADAAFARGWNLDSLAFALRDALAAERDRVVELEAENVRLRKALAFYAHGDWHARYPGGILYKGSDDDEPNSLDYGGIARAALTGEGDQ